MPTVDVTAPFSSSDHNSVSFTNTVEHCSFVPVQESSKESSKYMYLWKQGDYAAMLQFLINYDWSHMVSTHLTPDDLWGAFCGVLYEAIDMFVPSVETQNNVNRGPKKKISI